MKTATALTLARSEITESTEGTTEGSEGTTEGAFPNGHVGEAKYDFRKLARALLKLNASDLHLKTGRPPLFRINGKLIASRVDSLTRDDIEEVVGGLLSERQIHDLEQKRYVDLSVEVSKVGRFRVNIYFQRDTLSAAIRVIHPAAASFDSLGIPKVIADLCMRPRGLILVTGSTGSGKSTTLSAVIQYINERQQLHILTIEDPIEFIHRDLKSTITQREVGSDIRSLYDGLLAGLRQDPDVIVIGELRDFQMMQTALTAAETGHLVISTLHTQSARSTIDRILDVFPGESKNQARIQLATSLVGVLSQQLLPRADGKGRVLACEVMVKSPAIEQYILNNEREKIRDAIANSNTYYQMQTMNQALESLITKKLITPEEGLMNSDNPDDLKMRLTGIIHEEGFNGPGK